MAGVTQVVTARETRLFHNRLTHSLEVAQIARRIAEKLLRDQPEVAVELGGIDADVVEAAALAHDLGHPPFGHLAEAELDRLLLEIDPRSGFEGNPQSFRIVTKLVDLNLTRATLNALLKYPWPRGKSGFEQKKWGFYDSERVDFDWARELYPTGDRRKSAEAEIMDWSDDIAYSVLDVEDFFRAGLIPLDRLQRDKNERAQFCAGVFERWKTKDKNPALRGKEEELKNAFDEVTDLMPITEPYRRNQRQRAALRTLTSSLIERYVKGIRLNVPKDAAQKRVEIRPAREMEVTMLKELTWTYVIESPALASQQHGQRLVVQGLFKMYLKAISDDRSIFPETTRDRILELGNSASEAELARVVVDLIASMTEQQATESYSRLSGLSGGSIFDDPLL